ncbi:MAG: DUF2961 domain-containing protein [Phycisphaerae bacterium]
MHAVYSVRRRAFVIVLTVVLLGHVGFAAAQTATSQPAVPMRTEPANALLERLLQLPGQFMVLQSSSHNKTGNNGDENWPLYKDEHGDDVIFDAAGPGCVRSIWGTHFTDDAVLKFYFDGESEPRYRVREIDFFSGTHPDFPPPLLSYERRGHYDVGLAGNSFLPIPYAKSLRISIEGESRFFHVLYETYPHGTPVETFTGREQHPALLDSFARLGEPPVADDGLEVVEVVSEENHPGHTVTLLKREDAAGIIRRIEFEADGSPEFFRESQIRVRWDGHVYNDVQTPIGFLFACPNQASDVRTLPVRVEPLPDGRARLTCNFPMPFWQQAEIVWQNKSSYRLGPLTARIYIGPNELDPARGTYFTTLYRAGETTYGRDWLLYESPGTGWFVGVVQSMQNGHYCEGDEHFYIDGAISPQINGTGSEDYFLSCFWPNLLWCSPFACCADDIYIQGGGHIFGAYRIPSAYARFHLEAPIPFQAGIDARIQHGGLSQLRSDYRSLAFCYLRRRPAMQQTDFLDVSNTASERAHQYECTPPATVVDLEARPEGAYFHTSLAGRGRRHEAGASICFTVAVSPDNNGVRLRRRLDQGSPCQAADVYVDGRLAGTWYHGYHNEHLRWYDADFDLPVELTRDRQSLAIRLVTRNEAGGGEFTDFCYWVYCFEPVAR